MKMYFYKDAEIRPTFYDNHEEITEHAKVLPLLVKQFRGCRLFLEALYYHLASIGIFSFFKYGVSEV